MSIIVPFPVTVKVLINKNKWDQTTLNYMNSDQLGMGCKQQELFIDCVEYNVEEATSP